MRCGKATAGTQRIGPVGEELDVRETAAEQREVPRAIDVRQRLEQADDADRQQRADREECGRPAQLAPVALDKGRDPAGPATERSARESPSDRRCASAR